MRCSAGTPPPPPLPSYTDTQRYSVRWTFFYAPLPIAIIKIQPVLSGAMQGSVKYRATATVVIYRAYLKPELYTLYVLSPQCGNVKNLPSSIVSARTIFPYQLYNVGSLPANDYRFCGSLDPYMTFGQSISRSSQIARHGSGGKIFLIASRPFVRKIVH